MPGNRVKLAVVALVSALISSTAAAQEQPVSLSEVTTRTKRAVDNGSATTRIGQSVVKNCRSFAMTDANIAQLKKAGADDALLATITGACEKLPEAQPARPVAAAPAAAGVAVQVKVGIVSAGKVTPAPEYTIALVSATGDTVAKDATNLDGELEFAAVKPGTYQLVTPESFPLEGKSYRWVQPITVKTGMRRIDLTGRNAKVEGATVAAAAPAPVAPTPAPVTAPPVTTPAATSSATIPVQKEPDSATVAATRAATTAAAAPDTTPAVTTPAPVAAAPTPTVSAPRPARTLKSATDVAAASKSAIVSVYGAEGRTNGFLIDSGLVMTTARAIRNTEEPTVQVNATTRVAAEVVSVDDDRDVAFLAINPSRCVGCTLVPVFDLANGDPAKPAENVLVVTQTDAPTGTVSAVTANSISTTATVPLDASGSPLLNLYGEAIGVTSLPNDRANTTSQAVNIASVASHVQRARDSLPSYGEDKISDAVLPVLSTNAVAPAVFNSLATAKSFDSDEYAPLVDPFQVLFMTPQVAAWRAARIKNVASKKGAKTVGGKVDPIEGWREWSSYVNDRRPAIIVNVIADQIGFPDLNPEKVFTFRPEEDFRDMKIFKDGEEIIPVEKIRIPIALNPDAYKAEGKRVAYQGIYVYRPEDFRGGSVYNVTITTADRQAPAKARLDPKLLDKIRKDVAAFAP